MSWKDYNDAPPQGAPESSEFDIPSLKERLLYRIEEVLMHLLPGVTFQGRERAYCGDINGHPGNSLQVELRGKKAGCFYDFDPSSPVQGGDLFDLWTHYLGYGGRFADSGQNAKTVLAAISEWLGEPSSDRRRRDHYRDRSRRKEREYLGPPVARWDYHGADGKRVVEVTRYEPEPGRKEFIPWDMIARKHQWPERRLLFRVPMLKDAHTVYICEGEKAASAISAAGLCGTCLMCGAGAAMKKGGLSGIERTDFEPLRGKHVILWPDADRAGQSFMLAVRDHLRRLAICKSVRILRIPDGTPDGWDAADCDDPGAFIKANLSDTPDESSVPGRKSLEFWKEAFVGAPEPRNYLVEGMFTLGDAGLIAAPGDCGKGFLSLDLAIKIVTHRDTTPGVTFLGHRVMQGGSAVVLTAEDNRAEVHRRLAALDPEGYRDRGPHRLITMPLPDNGGPMPLIAPGRDGLKLTPDYHWLMNELRSVHDLKMVVFDHLSAFAPLELSSNNVHAMQAMGMFAHMATELGAFLWIAHHMTKAGRAIVTTEDARAAIRGATGITDGVRIAVALWKPERQRQEFVFRALNMDFRENAVYHAAIVKSNGPADRHERILVRNAAGLLVDRTDTIMAIAPRKDDMLILMAGDIDSAAESGFPFTITGEHGVHKNRHRLHQCLRELSRSRIDGMIESLLADKKIVKVRHHGTGTTAKWLAKPKSKFAKGLIDIEYGEETSSEDSDGL